jgi:hypothetical protein
VRKKISNKNIDLCIVFSKGEGAVTGEAVDNEQPPYEIFFHLPFRARRLVIWSSRVILTF